MGKQKANQTQPAKPTVACPKCGRQQPIRTADALYWCEHCRGQFDGQPEEGGDYSDRDPSARLERQERQQSGRRPYQGRR
jgi:ribosomal protein L37AE/L43A